MTALISALAHLFALLRGWLDDRRSAAHDTGIRTAEADRINAEAQTHAREADHAAQDEMARPSGRDDTSGRLRDGTF
jgi:Flp pilus assembly protein TadB